MKRQQSIKNNNEYLLTCFNGSCNYLIRQLFLYANIVIENFFQTKHAVQNTYRSLSLKYCMSIIYTFNQLFSLLHLHIFYVQSVSFYILTITYTYLRFRHINRLHEQFLITILYTITSNVSVMNFSIIYQILVTIIKIILDIRLSYNCGEFDVCFLVPRVLINA